MIDRPTCNCGIFGIVGAKDAAISTYYGLHALQHRGQEAAELLHLLKTKMENLFLIFIEQWD